MDELDSNFNILILTNYTLYCLLMHKREKDVI